MSEHWKSTPKYWCKHCSTYVRDTKFERNQHEATGKHQGNLKRFLRGIQTGQEKDEREKMRAKAEVERLNKVIGGSAAGTGSADGLSTKKSSMVPPAPQPSAAERKQRLAQLIEMGISIPDEYRGDMAVAGDWKVLSQKQVVETSPEQALNIGVRKRKHEGQGEEEEEAGETVVSKGWGSTRKRYPGEDRGGSGDLDALLSSKVLMKKEDSTLLAKTEPLDSPKLDQESDSTKREEPEVLMKGRIKDEDDADKDIEPAVLSSVPDHHPVPQAIFKKRKPKVIRSK